MRTRGHFTKALTGLKPHDIVKVRGPFGGFVFDAERDKDVVLVAGGIGITPFMSMVRFASTIHAMNKITLVYSCAVQDDVPFLDELVSHQKMNPNLRVVFVVADGPIDKLADQSVLTGRVTPEVLDKAAEGRYSARTFFLCGPPPFMNAVTGVLRDKNVDQSQIMTEAFSQGSRRQTGQIRSWPYNMYVSGAVGLTLASLAVMFNDLLRALPPSSLIDNPYNASSGILTNSRQTDLDSIVNTLPALDSGAPVSSAVASALAEAAIAEQQHAQAPVQAAPAPAPQPAPTCTTTASGVKVC